MTQSAFPYCHKKTTQALNFFAEKAGGKVNKLKALKLIFFADRNHFREHGRPILGDSYVAMKYGPVASGAKNIAEHSPFANASHIKYANRFIKPEDEFFIRSVKEVDQDELSESDIDSLSWSWKVFGKMKKYDLAELTHEYPEWSRHKQSVEVFNSVQMNYEEFLDDPVHDKYFKPISPAKKEAILSLIHENQTIYSL